MAIFSQRLNFGFFDASGNGTLNNSVPLTGGSAQGVSDTVPVSTNKAFSLSFIKANLQLFYAVADQDVTFTTSGADTFTLAADKPMAWFSGGEFANPFAGDVSAAFVRNGAVATANVEIRTLASA